VLSDMICGQAQTRTIQRHAISGILLVMQLLQGSIQGPPGHPLTKLQIVPLGKPGMQFAVGAAQSKLVQ
jgi:hypothetical protein